MNDLLTELGLKYGTDKATHHKFTPFYNQYFESIRFEVKNILEIGILNNASLKMWEEYFPNANIYGLDNQDKSHCDGGRIKTFLADQGSREQLKNVVEQLPLLDIIIDDGSHLIPHQYITLATLMPYVKPGGFYVLEDLHTSYFPKWQEWYDPEVKVTMLESIQLLKKNISDTNTEFKYQYITDEEAELVKSSVEEIDIFDRTGNFDSITAVITKK